MIYDGKIPIVVGVAGHRDIDDGDHEKHKCEVAVALAEIRALCTDNKGGQSTPIIMLNAFAQGADVLCAEVALEMGIDVYAVLPREKSEHIESFKDESERQKLIGCLEGIKKIIVASDIEENGDWLAEKFNMNASDYAYRQAGIYIAEHSHIVLALWDGELPKNEFECGTFEMIKFALDHKFLDRDHLFNPGILNDSAVLWLNVRREGEAKPLSEWRWLVGEFAKEEGTAKHLNYYICKCAPKYLRNMIRETVKYNSQACGEYGAGSKLWANPEELDDYRTNLMCHYDKADGVSFNRNQKYYNLLILLVAIIGTFVAFSFMLYDDAALTFMILPCMIAVCVLLVLIRRGNKKGYHSGYIEYRALAEACRIQFYMSLCLNEAPIFSNVCRLYSWTQKVDFAWIYKALQAVAAISDAKTLNIETAKIIDVWIGDSDEPEGQHKYHTKKLSQNRGKEKKYENITSCLNVVTIAVYVAIFILEVVTHILNVFRLDWFWEGEIVGIPWRSVGIIVMGTITAASLLFTSYFGKLSFGRKAEDNQKMSMFYASACARWGEAKLRPDAEIKKFVKEIAREEIVENGIWYSYVRDNSLEINI